VGDVVKVKVAEVKAEVARGEAVWAVEINPAPAQRETVSAQTAGIKCPM